MDKRKFSKPALSISRQIELLKGRGLAIADEERAKRYLNTVGYYRLSGYMFSFLRDTQNHVYKEGASFDNVLDLYFFDRELRLLVFSAIEKIEIAFRAQIVQRFSESLENPFWLNDASTFRGRGNFLDTTASLVSTLNRSGDIFIKHFNEAYSDPFPPAWMIFETLQLGQLSRIFCGLKNCRAKQDIASFFGVTHQVLETWMHTLVYVRNICAHHARLWNKVLRIKPMLPEKPARKWVEQKMANDKFFVAFCIAKYLLDAVAPKNHFVQKFNALLEKHPSVNLANMGFFEGWEDEPLLSENKNS